MGDLLKNMRRDRLGATFHRLRERASWRECRASPLCANSHREHPSPADSRRGFPDRSLRRGAFSGPGYDLSVAVTLKIIPFFTFTVPPSFSEPCGLAGGPSS